MGIRGKTNEGIVALFNASDDTIDMVQGLLEETNAGQSLVWCHFADLKKGVIDFEKYITKYNPEVVVFDISPPYRENWAFFKTLRDSSAMKNRGMVLTTTNKERLDETVGQDSKAIEIVGKPYDLGQIKVAIHAAIQRVLKVQRPRGITPPMS